jgi:hypothetical protein
LHGERDALLEHVVHGHRELSRHRLRVLAPFGPSRRELSGPIADPGVVALDERLGFEGLPQVHVCVRKLVSRVHRAPVFPPHDECIASQGLTAPVELESRQIHAAEEEAELAEFLGIGEVDVALYRGGQDDVVVHRREGREAGLLL